MRNCHLVSVYSFQGSLAGERDVRCRWCRRRGWVHDTQRDPFRGNPEAGSSEKPGRSKSFKLDNLRLTVSDKNHCSSSRVLTPTALKGQLLNRSSTTHEVWHKTSSWQKAEQLSKVWVTVTHFVNIENLISRRLLKLSKESNLSPRKRKVLKT